MEHKPEERVSRSKTIRKSMREAFGIRKNREKMPVARKIDSRLSEYFRDHDNAASRVSDEKISQVRDIMDPTDRTAFKDADIALALVSDFSSGDPEKAYDLLATLERAEAGELEPYSPDTTLAGAVNRNGVTCWLDSVLFAMFARSDDFDPMLFHTFSEPSKKRLAILIRLWINLLRSGKLVTIGITQQIQECLADCGWPEAASRQQQDASEAFGRLTEFLQLPPLTLKKDMFHQGKADSDDHKFTHERTIDIGIPPAREDGSPITLEDCLESYFDETVNVSRQKEESARRNTVGSSWSKALEAGGVGDVKNKALHIEVAEVGASSPATLTPTSPLPPYGDSAFPPSLADAGRKSSIFTQKKIDSRPMSPERKSSLPNPHRKRAATTSKQVSMRAFQFFRLIPWYTEGNPNTDLQVAQHFESKRPAVGICLKRFSALDNTGTKWTKRKDYIDIPIESGIPGFIHDDDLGEEVFPNWKFKLSLQSAICHRGDTLERGHYISVVRVKRPLETIPMPGIEHIPQDESDPWVIHDDLARPSRVQYVDIEKVLKEETPYLLFYKIVLIEGEKNTGRVSFDGRPPSYSSSEDQSRALSLKSPAATSPTSSARPSQSGNTSLSAAPPFTRAKSNSSSVISNTPGPPIAVRSATLPETAVNGFKQEGVGPVEGQISESNQLVGGSAEERVAEAVSKDQGEQAPARKSEERARSRHSNSSNSGSISRLSQIFKPRASSKEARVAQDEAVAENTQPAAGTVNVTTSSASASSKLAAEEPLQSTRRGFRKSMDEMRNSRRREKEKEKEKEGGHRHDRVAGGRRKSRRFDDPDRECSVM